jgi:hypothetical protein
LPFIAEIIKAGAWKPPGRTPVPSFDNGGDYDEGDDDDCVFDDRGNDGNNDIDINNNFHNGDDYNNNDEDFNNFVDGVDDGDADLGPQGDHEGITIINLINTITPSF